jgi:hypothetical protein
MYRYVLLEKCRITVQVGTYRYVLVQENVKKYVRVRTQLRTERYRAVQKGTGQYTKWYKAVQVKVQQGTRQYMAVHVSTRSAFAPGRGPGGRPILVRFSNRCIDCTNSGFSFKSLHAQTRLFIAWRPCPCQCYSPPPFATRGQLRRRRRLAMPRQAPRQPQPQPRVAASHPDPLPHRRPRPGAAGGTSTCGGEEAFEVTVLVAMNGVGRFLVPGVGTGDRVDDEAEDVKLHHTSCVSPFAHHNDNLNQQTFK